MMKRGVMIVALCLVAAGTAQAQDDAAPGQAVRPVKLQTAAPEDMRIRRRFFGQVRARQTTDLSFQVAGQIVDLPVSEGERVKEGDVIARLDLEPFELAVEQAEIEVEQARRDRERLESLGPETVSRVNLQDARSAENLARIALRQAQNRFDDATLRAPFDALVVRREVANFATVGAGTPVVRLHDMSELRVDIEVPEVLFREARGNLDVDFAATFPGDDTAYPLTLREFEAETADVGQTYSLTLAFEQVPGPWLLPGASTTVAASAEGGGDDVIEVPQTAVVFGPDRQAAVMVFEEGEDGTGTVTRRPVEVAADADGGVDIVSGLEPGEEIVAAGAAQLRDGQTVRRYFAAGE